MCQRPALARRVVGIDNDGDREPGERAAYLLGLVPDHHHYGIESGLNVCQCCAANHRLPADVGEQLVGSAITPRHTGSEHEPGHLAQHGNPCIACGLAVNELRVPMHAKDRAS